MSVLIKGMEMPKYGCDNCFLRTGNYCGRIEKNEAVVEYARKNERHPDCPLVFIPPHGDLISRSALIVDLMDRGIEGIQTDDWHEIQQAIMDAPTIILAEEGE